MQEMTALTGFDPTRDVRNCWWPRIPLRRQGKQHSGLSLARGTFDPARIAGLATQHEAITESYKGVTILEDRRQMNGVAFLNATLVVAGDIAKCEGCDRPSRNAPSALPAAVMVQVNQWSNSQDAWVVSAVAPSSLVPPAGAPQLPGIGGGANGANAFNSIQQAAGGVKFGVLVEVKAQAQADTSQNASSMADALKLLANLGMMQANSDPALEGGADIVHGERSGESVECVGELAAGSTADDFEAEGGRQKATAKDVDSGAWRGSGGRLAMRRHECLRHKISELLQGGGW